jgi:hypothetical protein
MRTDLRWMRLPWAGWLSAGVVIAIGLSAWLLAPSDVAPRARAAPNDVVPVAKLVDTGEEPIFTFVSMPDFVNTDVGDLRVRAGQGWDPGDPTSINGAWTRAFDVILDEVQAEEPAAVLVAGDLVDGHWGMDVEPATGIFGPVGTRQEQLAAVTNAGALYYGQWLDRFEERGLRTLPALGDHEIGDNPWPAGTFKYDAVPTYKKAWADAFTKTAAGGHRYTMRPRGTAFEDTAYAVRIANTLFVSVDVFRQTADGVDVTVGRAQLRWLDRLLGRVRAKGVEHIVVQGHTPVLGPVRARHSSELTMAGGAQSAFWRLLARHDVDLYLAGEMHDMTTLRAGGVVQVVHGALATWGEANYLVGDVYADRIELTLKEFRGARTNGKKLWNTDRKGPAKGIRFQRGPATVGTMVIDKTGAETVLRQRRGRLAEGCHSECVVVPPQ